MKDHHGRELELQKGDIVNVLQMDETGWWGGHKVGEDKAGWFPRDCVRLRTSSSANSEEESSSVQTPQFSPCTNSQDLPKFGSVGQLSLGLKLKPTPSLSDASKENCQQVADIAEARACQVLKLKQDIAELRRKYEYLDAPEDKLIEDLQKQLASEISQRHSAENMCHQLQNQLKLKCEADEQEEASLKKCLEEMNAALSKHTNLGGAGLKGCRREMGLGNLSLNNVLLPGFSSMQDSVRTVMQLGIDVCDKSDELAEVVFGMSPMHSKGRSDEFSRPLGSTLPRELLLTPQNQSGYAKDDREPVVSVSDRIRYFEPVSAR